MGDSGGEGHWDFLGPTGGHEPICESMRDPEQLGFGEGVRERDEERKEGHLLQAHCIPDWGGGVADSCSFMYAVGAGQLSPFH